MICLNCGKHVDDDVRVCPFCGALIEAEDAAPEETAEADPMPINISRREVADDGFERIERPEPVEPAPAAPVYPAPEGYGSLDQQYAPYGYAEPVSELIRQHLKSDYVPQLEADGFDVEELMNSSVSPESAWVILASSTSSRIDTSIWFRTNCCAMKK